jgi:hypothetical protein
MRTQILSNHKACRCGAKGTENSVSKHGSTGAEDPGRRGSAPEQVQRLPGPPAVLRWVGRWTSLSSATAPAAGDDRKRGSVEKMLPEEGERRRSGVGCEGRRQLRGSGGGAAATAAD